MTLPNIEEALLQLKPKKKAALIRKYMPLIEDKLAEGVSLDDIVQVLGDADIKVNKATLKSYLYIYRKKKTKSVHPEAEQTAIAAATTGHVLQTIQDLPDMTPEVMAMYEEAGLKRIKDTK